MRRSMMLAVALLAASFGAAAEYPDKTLRLIVPFAAGGARDIIARAVADRLGKRLGQAVVVDNKPGAGGAWGPNSPPRRRRMAIR